MKHCWEKQEIRQVGVGYRETICVQCGYVKRETVEAYGRRGYRNRSYERLDKRSRQAPVCDGIWPDGWRIPKHYSMFLDDVRIPSAVPKTAWVIVRSFDEAMLRIERYGMPDEISFDHDLGDGVPTGFDFAKWLVNRHLDGIDDLPESFSYAVHSANPPGAANITGLLDNFLHFLAIEKENKAAEHKLGK